MVDKFSSIEYSDIDLDKTKELLKQQGVLYIELSPLRAETMITLLNIEKKFRSIEYKNNQKLRDCYRAYGILFAQSL